jgi:hypothetical protein
MSQFLDRSGARSDFIDNEMNPVLAISRVASSISLLTIKCGEDTAPGHHTTVYHPSLRVLGYLQWYIELYIPPRPPKPVVIFIFPPHLRVRLGKTWLSSLRLG